MMFVGIDPGSSGAVATIEEAHPFDRVRFFDTPVTKIEGRSVIQPDGCSLIVLGLPAAALIAIEKSQPMPSIRNAKESRGADPAGHGTIGAFRLGYSFGLWVGILAAVGVQPRYVRPQQWKQMLLPKDRDPRDKGLSRKIAVELYPMTEYDLERVKDHGRAEALLLAHYARCMHRVGQ